MGTVYPRWRGLKVQFNELFWPGFPRLNRGWSRALTQPQWKCWPAWLNPGRWNCHLHRNWHGKTNKWCNKTEEAYLLAWNGLKRDKNMLHSSTRMFALAWSFWPSWTCSNETAWFTIAQTDLGGHPYLPFIMGESGSGGGTWFSVGGSAAAPLNLAETIGETTWRNLTLFLCLSLRWWRSSLKSPNLASPLALPTHLLVPVPAPEYTPPPGGQCHFNHCWLQGFRNG